mgnify:CR=1 FL=1
MNYEDYQTARYNRKNKRCVIIMLMLIMVAVGIHCYHHRQLLFFGKVGSGSQSYSADWINDTLIEYIGDGFRLASWYGKAYHGRITASGSKYDMFDLTFAHRKLPFGTVVRFTHNGKSVTGTCTDRGPFITGIEYDLSFAMAESLGYTRLGLACVRAEVIR